MESLNWLTFPDIMEFIEDIIENDKNILASLFNFFTIFRIKRWQNKKDKGDLKQTVEKFATRFSNCKKNNDIVGFIGNQLPINIHSLRIE